MGTSPRDIRIEALHEIGVKIDDALEAAQAEVIRREGAHAAYVLAGRHIAALLKTAPEHADAWKRAALICEQLATQAHAAAHAAKGAVAQSQALIGVVKSMHDLEVVKKERESVPLPVEPEQPAPRRAPLRTIREQRLAAAATESAAAKKPRKRGRSKNEEK